MGRVPDVMLYTEVTVIGPTNGKPRQEVAASSVVATEYPQPFLCERPAIKERGIPAGLPWKIQRYADSDVAATTAENRASMRIVSAMRVILTVAALTSSYADPDERAIVGAITHLAIVLYAVFSATIYLLVVRTDRQLPEVLLHWIDVIWCTLLIAATGGSSSIFFFYYFFAIITAAFRWGFAMGLCTAIMSAVLQLAASFMVMFSGGAIDLGRFMLRPFLLVGLGLILAHWGHSEIMLKRRLALLKEIAGTANPRFGVEATIRSMLERLRRFYATEATLLASQDRTGDGFSLYRADEPEGRGITPPGSDDSLLAQTLLGLPDSAVLVYCGPGERGPFGERHRSAICFNGATGETCEFCDDALPAILNALRARFILSVPVTYNQVVGRLYLTSMSYEFTHSDADFMLQVVEQVRPILDNIHLLDKLATHAAEEERRRLARDIHDSIIQPYIGLQFGLSAIRRKLAASANVENEVDELLEMTKDGVADIRRYIDGLNEGVGLESSILAAVRRFAARYREATGIDVEIDAKPDLDIHTRLAAEVFQMIAEGLSNIRRHSEATRAVVRMFYDDKHFILKIEDSGRSDKARRVPVRGGTAPGVNLAERDNGGPFVPRSITARAEALGGAVSVVRNDTGPTVVTVDIPVL